MSTLYRIAFRADMKSCQIHYERQRHRNGTVVTHIEHPTRAAEPAYPEIGRYSFFFFASLAREGKKNKRLIHSFNKPSTVS